MRGSERGCGRASQGGRSQGEFSDTDDQYFEEFEDGVVTHESPMELDEDELLLRFEIIMQQKLVVVSGDGQKNSTNEHTLSDQDMIGALQKRKRDLLALPSFVTSDVKAVVSTQSGGQHSSSPGPCYNPKMGP